MLYYSTRTPGAGIASSLTVHLSVLGQVGYKFAAAGSLRVCEMTSREEGAEMCGLARGYWRKFSKVSS